MEFDRLSETAAREVVEVAELELVVKIGWHHFWWLQAPFLLKIL